MERLKKNADGSYLIVGTSHSVGGLREAEAELLSMIFEAEKMTPSESVELLEDIHNQACAARNVVKAFSTLEPGQHVQDSLGRDYTVINVERKSNGMPANIVELTNASGVTSFVQEQYFGEYSRPYP